MSTKSRTIPPTRQPARASKKSTVEADRLQTKAEMDARTERRARAMLDEAASLAPAPTKADAELDDQLSEKARVAWTQDGLLMPATELAQEWQMTRQGLDRAADRNELVLLKIKHRLWAPAVFGELPRDAVKQVSQTMPGADEVSQFFFWMRPHGALGGKTPAQAIRAGRLVRVLEIARGTAEENGWVDA